MTLKKEKAFKSSFFVETEWVHLTCLRNLIKPTFLVLRQIKLLATLHLSQDIQKTILITL